MFLNYKDDLLAFQLSHFGDDTKPDAWFVDAETALSYQPEFDQDLGEEEDDGLGYYEDGVERTLTDEQIEMFRHTEMEQLIREGLISRDERESEQNEVVERAKHTSEDMDTESLLSVETPTKHNDRRNSSASRRSSSTTKGRQRAKDIPYDERNKRNWETYIEDEDPRHGSRTHRRIVRELDEQQVQDVELDY